MRLRIVLASFTLSAAVALGAGSAFAQEKLTIFAAASLKNALDEINGACEASVGEKAAISYAASSALAKQIESGAPADIFMSADRDWMKYLSDKSLTKKDTEAELLGNSIVLVAPASSDTNVTISQGFDLASALKGGKLAMANVDSVPAGKYGKASLEKLGAWEGVKGSVAQAENVRAALALVSTGEAPLGIVYKTDAAADTKVKIVGMFPQDSHAPIVYPVAETVESKNPAADKFLDCLEGPAAKAAFERQGFTILGAN